MLHIQRLDKKDIDIIKPFWQKLNQIHSDDSIYFKKFYENFTFEQRMENVINKDEKNLYISLVRNGSDICGYCISTIEDTIGEIQSIYLEKHARFRGIGKILIVQHINWMKENSCKKIILCVTYGHNDVLSFYHKIGFFERFISLEYKEQSIE